MARVARAFERLPPADPRRSLLRDDVRRAHKVLGRLGAEPPKRVAAEDEAWFEATIRPRLAAWVAFDERQRRWERQESLRRRELDQRRLRQRLGWGPAQETLGLPAEARRAARALLGLAAEPPAVETWDPHAPRAEEDESEESLTRRREITARVERLRREMAEERQRASGSVDSLF